MGTAHNIIKNAHRKGLKLLGSGCYSAVLELNENSVLKIGADTLDPYLYFLESVQQSDNPHFPKILDIHVDIKNNFYIIKLEKLKPLTDYSAYKDLYNWVFKNKRFPEWANEDLQHAVDHLVALADFKTHTDAIIAEKGGLLIDEDSCILDLHEANVMTREDGTIVFTDPLCNYHMYDIPEIEDWTLTNLR